MNDEIKEILDYFQKDVDKYEESKRYLMQKYGYDEEIIDNISQHERHINTKKLLDYITNLQQDYERANQYIDFYKDLVNKQSKRNSRQRLANQKQQELILKLQQENERLKMQVKKDNHILGCNFASKDKYKQRYEDYKSRCEKASETVDNMISNGWILEQAGTFTGYSPAKKCCKVRLEKIKNILHISG